MIGGTIQISNKIVRMVRIVLSGPANRLARIQPITPVMAIGAGIASTGVSRT